MAVTFQSLYRCMNDAMKLDHDNENREAYIQYLKSVSVATTFLVERSYPSVNTNEVDFLEVQKGIKLIKMCVQRLETLIEQHNSNLRQSQDLPPSYSEVTLSPSADSTTPSCSTPVNKIMSSDEDESWSEVPTTDDSVSSCATDSVDSSPSSSGRQLSTVEPMEAETLHRSRMARPSPMELAIKRNKMLVQRYHNRLANIKQPSNRVQAVLELQRRLADNLKTAELEQKKIKESQKRQQNEVIQKVRRKLKDVIQNNGESASVDSRVSDLCRKCIHYEQEQEQTWPNDLRDCLLMDVNANLVSYIVHETLNTADYPLSKWLQTRQRDFLQRLSQKLQPHAQVLRQISHPDYCDMSASPIKEEEQAYVPELTAVLHDVVGSIKDTIDIATEVLMLIYLDIEKLSDGRSICTTAIEECLFKAIWIPLRRLYRLVYHQEEMIIKQVMAQCKNEPFEYLGMKKSNYPNLQEVSCKAMVHLREVVRLSCPSHKVDKLVQVFMLLTDHSKIPNSKSLGADELIPILTYIFIMCNKSELITEIYSMQGFMSESDMFGHKGYCISSMQTVLSYILTLDSPVNAAVVD